MTKPPYYTAIRVFPSDAGFSYRIEIWVGDVDIRNTEPHRIDESKRAYKSPAVATNAMLARLAALLAFKAKANVRETQ